MPEIDCHGPRNMLDTLILWAGGGEPHGGERASKDLVLCAGLVLTPGVDPAPLQPCETFQVMSTQLISMRCSILSKRADTRSRPISWRPGWTSIPSSA